MSLKHGVITGKEACKAFEDKGVHYIISTRTKSPCLKSNEFLLLSLLGQMDVVESQVATLKKNKLQ